MRRQGSWGREVRQGTTSQRCVYAVRADFPGLCSMNLYYAYPFISTNFNHCIHISQATSWCQNLCMPIALESKGKIQRWKSQWERKKRWKVPNQLKAYVQSNVFFTFCHFKTHTFPGRIENPVQMTMQLYVDCESYFRVRMHHSLAMEGVGGG